MPVTITYRKREGEIFWHIFEECKYWPTENYNEITSQHPPSGGFCPYCTRRSVDEFFATKDRFLK
jgi:hypothetical protein